jgi:hypothetical protein
MNMENGHSERGKKKERSYQWTPSMLSLWIVRAMCAL